MNGPRRYYAKWNKSDKEKQILYDFTYMQNLKKWNKGINVENRVDSQGTNKWLLEEGEEGGWVKIGEGD